MKSKKPEQKIIIQPNPIMDNHWEVMINEIDGIFYRNSIANWRENI
jgi:hypothetical protein